MQAPANSSISSGSGLTAESQAVDYHERFLGGVFILIDGPTHVADIESFIADWVNDNEDLLKSFGSLVDFDDKRAIVKRIWEILNNPGRPCDHISVNDRVRMIGYLERLFRTQIRNTAQLKELVSRFLGGLDGRRLAIPQALKRARKKFRLSQRQLAELLGLKDHTLISKYESGKRAPTGGILAWLKEAENVTGKRRVKGNSRNPASSVTSLWGKPASISAISGKSETSAKRPKCTDADDPPQTALESATPEAETNPSADPKKVNHV